MTLKQIIFDLTRAIVALNRKVDSLVSKISDFADQVNANFVKIQQGITSLDQQIQTLQNSPGELSPSDQAALDQIAAQSAALAQAAQAPIVPPASQTP